MGRARAVVAWVALLGTAGCSAVLGIDGSYGDQPSGGDSGDDAGADAVGASSDAASPPPRSDAGGPAMSSPEAGGPGESTDAAQSDDAARDDAPATGHPQDAAPGDGASTPVDASGAGDANGAGDDDGGSGVVTATNRRIAFGPSASGSGAPAVFAVRDDGVVVEWSFGATMTASPAAGVPAATAIAGGTHVCVVAASDGSLWCWGPGSPAPASETPAQIPGTGTGTGLWTMRGVAVGDTFTCILDDKGTVGCAGTLAGWTSPGGALSYPVFTGGMFASGQLFTASDISAAGSAVCVVNDSPTSGLYCWGSNAELVAAPTGAIGATQAYPWVVLSSPNDAVTVSVSPSHACTTYRKNAAGKTEGVCWGEVPDVVTDGGGPVSWDPLSAAGASAVVTTGAPGVEATFLVLSDGTVKGAGQWPSTTAAGLLGPSNAAGSATFVPIQGLASVEEVAASGTEACARTTAGAVDCWGSSGSGAAEPPTRVTGLP